VPGPAGPVWFVSARRARRSILVRVGWGARRPFLRLLRRGRQGDDRQAGAGPAGAGDGRGRAGRQRARPGGGGLPPPGPWSTSRAAAARAARGWFRQMPA